MSRLAPVSGDLQRVWPPDGPIANNVEGEGKGRYADAIHRWARLGTVSKTTRDRFIADQQARKGPPSTMLAIAIAHVVAAAGEQLAAAGMAERCTTVGGDFFVEVPPGGDVYLLAQILHDWDDEHSVDILRQCRRAMPAHGKLLVIELVLPAGEEPFFGKWLDVHMLVLLGARERTAAEYEALFHLAGFELARVVATSAGPSIVEAVPV